jgi:hypothetical protein
VLRLRIIDWVCIVQRFSNCGARCPERGTVCQLGDGHTYFERSMGVQDKVYILADTLFCSNMKLCFILKLTIY